MQAFRRSLSNLARDFNICVIILNGCRTFKDDTGDNVSIFSSIKGKPTLGKTFRSFCDVHVFLSQVPKTKEDAEIISSGRGHIRSPEMCRVAEVIEDRHRNRMGWWGAYQIVSYNANVLHSMC